MKIYVQYATDPPEEWQEYDSSEWSSLPCSLTTPTGHEDITDQKLWIHAINIQGVTFDSYDHYAVIDQTDYAEITVWNNDPEDWKDDYYAKVWQFRPIVHDPKINGLNTRQSFDIYCESNNRLSRHNRNMTVRHRYNYADFQEPDSMYVKHGIWVPEDLNTKLLKLQISHGWREWIN